MQTLDQVIEQAPIFGGLPERHLDALARVAREQQATVGAYLLRTGDPADRFYLIREGTVALEVEAPGRGAILIETLSAGEIAGFSWLFEPYRWQFDARATVPLSLVSFDGAALRAACEADHELGFQLMRRLAATAVARLQATRLQLLDVYGNPGAR
jgi:CRP/FNR family transcriptional regulator, cyclic AMP receptor protein